MPSGGSTCQVTIGKPSSRELADEGEDRGIGTVDADRIELGARDGGFGERQRAGDVPVGGARIADDLAGVAELLALIEEALLHQAVDRVVAHRLHPEQVLAVLRRGGAGDAHHRDRGKQRRRCRVLSFHHSVFSLRNGRRSSPAPHLLVRCRGLARRRLFLLLRFGRRSALARASPAAGDEDAPAQDVEADGEHHDRADGDLLPVGVDADDDEAALHAPAEGGCRSGRRPSSRRRRTG